MHGSLCICFGEIWKFKINVIFFSVTKKKPHEIDILLSDVYPNHNMLYQMYQVRKKLQIKNTTGISFFLVNDIQVKDDPIFFIIWAHTLSLH